MDDQRSINAIDRLCQQSLDNSRARRQVETSKRQWRKTRRWLLFVLVVVAVAVAVFMVVVIGGR